MKKYALCLQLFAEGGDGAAAVGGETEGVTADPTATTGVETASPDAENAAEDRKTQYAKFKEDYKAEYDADVQSIVKDRLKKSSSQNAELQKRLSSLAPIMDTYAKKYGITDPTDYDAIVTAYLNDDSIYEDEAYERGMTTEQVKEFHRIERENQSYREAEEERKRQEAFEEEERKRQAIFTEWDRQIAEVKQIYPNFDIGVERKNDQFLKMMNAGVNVRTAYEVAHKDELMRGAMQFTAQKVQEKVTNAIASNKARPSENGLSSHATAIVKEDVWNYSKDQLADIKRRAMAGEKVTFNK